VRTAPLAQLVERPVYTGMVVGSSPTGCTNETRENSEIVYSYMNVTPKCVGIIMDGNRRWAKAQGLSPLLGHHEGLKTLRTIVRAAKERGIEHLIIYAFSTENWNRTGEEVEYLMNLFQKEFDTFKEEEVRLRFVGQRQRFSKDMQEMMSNLEKETAHKGPYTFWICLSYGGRAEIVHAANEAAKEGGDITEESLSRHLWTLEMPDPDLIIRTSGEMRLSGFLPWQSIYSELFFTNTLWPDFSVDEFDQILKEYSERERRHGK
jgi:undecaprenyl diphosphate synthase